jgi:hypothetical protein
MSRLLHLKLSIPVHKSHSAIEDIESLDDLYLQKFCRRKFGQEKWRLKMRKIILSLAAVLLTTGASLANDRYGDAAPSSVVVSAPRTIDYSGTAAIGATSTGVKNDRYGDAAPNSVVVSQPKSLDYSGTAAIGATTNGLKNNRYGDGANSMY